MVWGARGNYRQAADRSCRIPHHVVVCRSQPVKWRHLNNALPVPTSGHKNIKECSSEQRIPKHEASRSQVFFFGIATVAGVDERDGEVASWSRYCHREALPIGKALFCLLFFPGCRVPWYQILLVFILTLYIWHARFSFFFSLKEFSRYFKNRLGRVLSVTADLQAYFICVWLLMVCRAKQR